MMASLRHAFRAVRWEVVQASPIAAFSVAWIICGCSLNLRGLAEIHDAGPGGTPATTGTGVAPGSGPGGSGGGGQGGMPSEIGGAGGRAGAPSGGADAALGEDGSDGNIDSADAS